ncbi:dolichyl-phosphate-mannose-protein mannosyltransferase [Tenacibaculum adriaticum]|uniref:Dolichyl-phosphate-mannose-protein mannosyltransferase n=1 Tax=Tenacibaculum adriaticum TaxID=413713 RepID=A0A5S5DMC2_9FLAO|nr:glycosyltransferase family 39 protein [Tenacibaculum adriaticum]TYP97001.1 dolichyl-phosphate-mannose-protein mannosyltransferase [Tenacibaculum adriaticum]
MLSFKKATFLFIFFSTLLRLFLGSSLEFGNDEVYYWLYAKYPDFSHFDHPPMVGFFIQFFTFNLEFDSEVIIRLAAIIPASIGMYLVFLIGSYLKDEKAGFIATILYNLNIYAFIIAGTFILPDSPLVLFWLLSFYFFIQVLPNEPDKKYRKKLFLAFFFLGCAIYSKYQAVFLLLGICLYVLLFNREWLKKNYFHLGFIFPLLAVFLIFYWNFQNNFISYKFHNNRVSLFSFKLNKDSFLREVLGQILYNNPYIVIIVILMIISWYKKQFVFEKKYIYLVFVCSFPLIFTTIYLSLFKDTLPHWSGVSYIALLPVAAIYLSKKENIHKKLLIGFSGFSLLLIIVTFVINEGWCLPKSTSDKIEKLGRKDVFMDMYGWQQTSEKVTKVLKEKNLINLPIVSNRWYPAAHIDYYIARPNNMKVYGVGSLKDTHKYYWVNQEHPPLQKKVLYITDSRNYKNPQKLYGEEYNTIDYIETIPIERNREIVKYVFVYRLSKE